MSGLPVFLLWVRRPYAPSAYAYTPNYLDTHGYARARAPRELPTTIQSTTKNMFTVGGAAVDLPVGGSRKVYSGLAVGRVLFPFSFSGIGPLRRAVYDITSTTATSSATSKYYYY